MKLRQFTTWAIVLGLTLPACAAERLGAISGYVRDASGAPQMGAVVQILGIADRTLTVFSDGAGYYTASGLIPGLYSLKVTAPSFLPTLRERVGVRAGASIHVNVTLNTLLDVLQLGPVRSIPDDDDCPVVAIATGHVHVAVAEVQAPAPVNVIEITPRVEVTVFVPSEKRLSNERAPPLSCA